MKIKFNKRGMDNKDLGDIGNFRIVSERFKTKNGDEAVLELGINFIARSKENKIILRSNINEYKNDGYCWGNSDFDREVNNLRLPYTLESVLKAVNLIAENKYTEIEFI